MCIRDRVGTVSISSTAQDNEYQKPSSFVPAGRVPKVDLTNNYISHLPSALGFVKSLRQAATRS
eukprot:3980909-Amphidinium_carterae.1